MQSQTREAPRPTHSHIRFPLVCVACLHALLGPCTAGAQLLCSCSRQPFGEDRCRHPRKAPPGEAPPSGHWPDPGRLHSSEHRAHSDHPQQGKRQIGSRQARSKLSFETGGRGGKGPPGFSHQGVGGTDAGPPWNSPLPDNLLLDFILSDPGGQKLL